MAQNHQVVWAKFVISIAEIFIFWWSISRCLIWQSLFHLVGSMTDSFVTRIIFFSKWHHRPGMNRISQVQFFDRLILSIWRWYKMINFTLIPQEVLQPTCFKGSTIQKPGSTQIWSFFVCIEHPDFGGQSMGQINDLTRTRIRFFFGRYKIHKP